MIRPICLITLLGMICRLAAAQAPASVSEKDFLGDMPIVLSVSRLPQRLDETPGAVTILDRHMIRMSGARDVADLLRFVPGFRVSNSFESNTPQGSYHNNLTDYANRIQVLVDGRSVYSPYLQGSVGPGLQTVAIEDIERIEVLRGSNSAAYGARAFLGTINIVTRDPVDTMGIQAQVASGDNGIQDTLVRIGWGDDRAGFRLGVDRRADNGLSGASGPDRVSRVNLRADLRLSAADQVELRAGQALIEAGVGFAKPGEEGNAVRSRSLDTLFVQFDWRRNLGVDEDLALSFSRMQEKTVDNFSYFGPVTEYFGRTIDYGGRASSDNLSLQHTFRKGSDLRLVWGGELRQERMASRPLYDTDAEFVTDFSRLFGNAEWRFHPRWVLNLGGMLERSNISGEHLSPRVMLNWHVADGHTMRYGVSKALRPPSTYEMFGRQVFRNPSLAWELPWVVARQNVQPERIFVREIGYLGDFPALAANLDVRIFEEEVFDLIKGSGTIPAYFENRENFKIHGVEYQLKWRPWRDAQLMLNQSLVDSSQSVSGDYPPRPYSSAGLMFMQKLSGGVDLSLMYHQVEQFQFPGHNTPAPAMSRTDLRLAKQLFFGNKRGEVSFVVQNLGPAYQDFRPDFYFRRQAFVMLRLDN